LIGKKRGDALANAETEAGKKEVKKLEEAYKIAGDNSKDFYNLITTYGFNEAKKKGKSLAESSAKSIPQKIDSLFHNIVMDWKESLTAMNHEVFSGTDASLQTLTKLIQNGNSLNRKPVNSVLVQKGATKFLVSILIPEVWRLQGYYPVMLDAGFPCTVSGIGIGQWTDRKNVGPAGICAMDEGGEYKDGRTWTGGRQYQLWAVKGEWDGKCKHQSNYEKACGVKGCDNYLTDLPGLKEMREPNNDWYGLDIFNLIWK
jgi:hypothetical protein